MEGFFKIKTDSSVYRKDGKVYSCVSCGLYKKCRTPKIKPYGKFRKKILIISDFPDRNEDKAGKPFRNDAGRYLKKVLAKNGIDIYKDCLTTFSTKCHPVNNETPAPFQVQSCRRFVLKIIETKKPQLIILLGDLPLTTVIGYRWKKALNGIATWRGWTIPDQYYKAWICPTYDPKLVQLYDKREMQKIFEKDIKIALSKRRKRIIYKEPVIEIITDLRPLNDIKGGEVTFDYETTGIKPYAPGHRILTCAVATSEDHTYAFKLPKTINKRLPLINLLANKKVRKIAQNIKYEDTWTNVRLRGVVNNWFWDTMLATHQIDNRPFITGAKFQTYVQFGIADYSSEVEPYLKAKDANSINKLAEYIKTKSGLEKTLNYNGYDTIYESRIAHKQIDIIGCPPF